MAVVAAPALAAPSGPNPLSPPPVVVAGAAVLGDGTSVVARPGSAERVSFRLQLDLRDPAAAERYAAAVATPGSADYGDFLTEDQFQARFGARPAQVAALRTWLTAHRIAVDEVVGNQIVMASGAVGDVAQAFATRIERVRSAAGRVAPAAVSPLRVPARFAGLVGGVTGLAPAREFRTYHSTAGLKSTLRPGTGRPEPRAAAAPPKDPTCPSFFGEFPARGVPKAPFSTRNVSYPECSLVVNPFTNAEVYFPGASTAKLRALSNVHSEYTGRGVTVGIVLWNYDPSSRGLTNIGAKTNRVQPLRTGQLSSVITNSGASDCQPVSEGDKVEINLDIQSVHNFAPDANIRFYGSSRCVVPDVSIAQALAEPNPPSVINNSWGTPNFDYDPADPTARSLHSSLVKASIRGVTVLFSSGDTGDGTLLRSNYPEASPQSPYPARTPSYPATDPYAVAVGGVGFGTASSGRPAFKQAWTPTYYSNPPGKPYWVTLTPRIFGGGPNTIGTVGGTSRSFAAPSWQKSAGVSSTGRKIPDISNASDLFFGPEVIAIIDPSTGGPVVTTVGGTSMGAPLTAGLVATANEFRGKRYLGLITPSLYRLRTSTAVSDVARFQAGVVVPSYFPNGLNLLVGEERPQESLITTAGWDNATGLGVPGTGFIGNIGR